METQQYIRRPFPVEAVQVTEDNINDVALWCIGSLEWTPTKSAPKGDNSRRRFIRVPVFQAKNEQQTFAFVGCWVLKVGKGFKVYTDRTFRKDFEPVPVEDNDDLGLLIETGEGLLKLN